MRALAALAGRTQAAYTSCGAPELLRRTLTGKRWALLQAMIGQGAMTIRESARRVGRNGKPEQRDV